MIPFQKLVGENGKENILFPLTAIWITQGENGGYTHQGSYAMDFQGYNDGVREFNAPLYAPFSCKCVLKRSSDGSIWWQSLDEVNFIDGTTGLATIIILHGDDFNSHYVGEIVTQGVYIGQTGTFPPDKVTGDHVHLEIAKGHQSTYVQNSYGTWMLKNSLSLYNAMGVNDTSLYKDYGYTWKYWEEKPIPPKKENDIIRLANAGVNNLWGSI